MRSASLAAKLPQGRPLRCEMRLPFSLQTSKLGHLTFRSIFPKSREADFLSDMPSSCRETVERSPSHIRPGDSMRRGGWSYRIKTLTGDEAVKVVVQSSGRHAKADPSAASA